MAGSKVDTELFLQVLEVFLVVSVCLGVGLLGALTIQAFMLAGAGWLGVLVALVLVASVGWVLGDLW